MSRMAGRGRGMLTRLARGESGYGTLTAVLILLILGALILTPLLVYMGTGLRAGQTHERRTDELYAADAGVDYAMWHLQYAGLEVPEDGSPVAIDQFGMNDKVVDVTISDVSTEDGYVYKIVSVSRTGDTNSATRVEAYVSRVRESSGLFDYAICSNSDITLNKESTIVGNVHSNGAITDKGVNITGNMTSVAAGDAPVKFPPMELATSHYRNDAKEGGTVEGDLVVPAGSGTTSEYHELGSVYVTGNLYIGKDCYIYVSGTVYVEGAITVAKGSKDDSEDFQLVEDARIIAHGDITLQKLNTLADAKILIMSITGDIEVKKELDASALMFAPEGTFTADKLIHLNGAIVADGVRLKKGAIIEYPPDLPEWPSIPPLGLAVNSYNIYTE